MRRTTFFTTLAIGAMACSNVAYAQAQQGNGSWSRTGVISAGPIHTQAMVALERSAQRLREAIQSLAQQPPGLGRDQAMSSARRALLDAQQAMIELPAEYRTSGIVLSNVPLAHANPAQNRTFGDSMRELELAADRLRDSIQAMSRYPAGSQRNEAIRQAHIALFQTERAIGWVPGYESTASAGRDRARGTLSARSGYGMVGGGITAGSDASQVEAAVPAVAGGVGLNARAMMSSEERPEHNVKLVFALNTGNYVADVAVRVKDRTGRTVIDGVSDGPWLYAKLPAGQYTATATYNGHTETRQFSVGSSGMREAHFRWPASVENNMVSGVSPILGTGPEIR